MGRAILSVITFKRLIFYGFPIYLVLADYGIRFLVSAFPGRDEDVSLVGSTSTVTAAGLSLIAPVLIPKPVTTISSQSQVVGMKKVVTIGAADQQLIACAVLALIVLPLLWAAALWMVHKNNADYDLDVLGMHIPAPFLIALAIYLFGMLLTELKELV